MTDHAQFVRDAVGAPRGYDREIGQVATAYQERDERIVQAGVNLGATRQEVQRVLDDASRPAHAQAAGNGDLADQVATLARTVGQLVDEARRRFGFRVNQ